MVSRFLIYGLCATVTAALAQVPAAQPVAPQSATVGTTSPAHILAAGERIEIRVFQEPDLDTAVRIPEDGRITFPLIGEVMLAGKSAQQAAKLIRDRLEERFLVNPQVSLAVVEQAKRLFTVLGQVQRPGTYRFPERQELELLQVIGIAGGYTRLADPGKITVKRQADGKVYKVNANRLAREAGAGGFAINAGDLITVGERLF